MLCLDRISNVFCWRCSTASVGVLNSLSGSWCLSMLRYRSKMLSMAWKAVGARVAWRCSWYSSGRVNSNMALGIVRYSPYAIR